MMMTRMMRTRMRNKCDAANFTILLNLFIIGGSLQAWSEALRRRIIIYGWVEDA